MNIKDIEDAWKARASESPEEIVEDAVDMAKSNVMSLQRHINSLLTMFNGDTTCFAEPWIQGKLNLADDYIKAVHDYIASENQEGESNARSK